MIFHRRAWGVTGKHLEKIVGVAGIRVTLQRRNWSRRGRVRNNTPQRRPPRVNVRPQQTLQQHDELGRSHATEDLVRHRLQRLAVSQQQCLDRTAHLEARLDQFRHAIRQDALDIATVLQGVVHDVQGQGQGMEQVRHALFDVAMETHPREVPPE